MRYAEVAVDAPVGYVRTLSYSIPTGSMVRPGQLVWVPLGKRQVQGVVFSLTDQPEVERVREIVGVYGPVPHVSPICLELARWISSHYLSSLFEAVSLFLPPGFRTGSHAVLQVGDSKGPLEGVPEDVARLLQYVRQHGRVVEEDVLKERGRSVNKAIAYLVGTGFIVRVFEMERPRTGLKYAVHLRLAVPRAQVQDAIGYLPGTASRQVALLRALQDSSTHLLALDTRTKYGVSAIEGLFRKGYVAEEWVRVTGMPFKEHGLPVEPRPEVLTPAQHDALRQIMAAMDTGRKGASFLIHGVTGSGKTEVYLRAMEHCLASGRQALFLVPEISLTPQILARLTARFPGRIAVLHSRLTPSQRLGQWWQVQEGAYDVVVGPRSALFAPLSRLGLIVMDEEHEWTYKQEEQSPRYHAREVARELARLAGAVVVMGSATPDVGTYFNATRGVHKLLELPARVTPPSGEALGREEVGAVSLADVQVVDMRRELRDGNRSIFSRALQHALEYTLARNEQVMLFLNRRGESTLVQCRDCGYVAKCKRCDTPLVYHVAGHLMCHHCNAHVKVPLVCPDCRGRRIRYMGLGTQRVVAEIRARFPNEEVVRWDSDVASVAEEHATLLERFASGKVRVIVGTQMIAKGLHIPSVTLVGVILADIGLYLPDLWAGERVFQLLCQVAGRAGRGSHRGHVIIQTYSPGHYAVRAGARQDYPEFFSQEIEFRREHNNPPFSRMAHLLYQHVNEIACHGEAERVSQRLRKQAYARGLSDVDVIGPAAAQPSRLRGRYRYHLIVRAGDPAAFLRDVELPKGWSVDIDPVSVL